MLIKKFLTIKIEAKACKSKSVQAGSLRSQDALLTAMRRRDAVALPGRSSYLSAPTGNT
jgi:hypothetical protein